MAGLPIEHDTRNPDVIDIDTSSSRCENRAQLEAEIERVIQESRKPLSAEQKAGLEEILRRMRTLKDLTPGPHPSAEEMLRKDRYGC